MTQDIESAVGHLFGFLAETNAAKFEVCLKTNDDRLLGGVWATSDPDLASALKAAADKWSAENENESGSALHIECL